MSASLHATFRALCRDFFPRWRDSASWTIMEDSHGSWVDTQGNTQTTTEQGYCDGTTKTIYVNNGWKDRAECRLLIIHEICHAVTSGGHGKRFCTRLRQAAQRASALGDMTLSAQLLEEADGYECGPAFDASPYSCIPEILCDNPGATFDDVLTKLAYDYTETPPALVEWYPHLRSVYHRTRRDEIATLRYQRKTARALGASEGVLTYIEERLRLLEAVSDDPTPATKRPRPRTAAPVG
jgi:hypothetical protein